MVAFTAGDWEGKGFKYYIRDSIRNRPQMVLVGAFYFVFLPIMLQITNYRHEKYCFPYARFKPVYTVMRDDDPEVANILKYNEKGERIYLEPRKN